MADGTIMIVLDVFNQVETFTKIILIMAAPIKVAPGVENPNSTDSILRIHTHSTPPIPMDTNSLTGALKSTAKAAAAVKEPITCSMEITWGLISTKLNAGAGLK